MLTLYHKPHSARRSEAAFVQALRRQFPQVTHQEENYPIAESHLYNYVETQSVLAALKQDHRLPKKQRDSCCAILSTCPPQIQVAREPTRISFDVVITSDQQVYFWEYHEDQHRGLTVNRPQQIYDATTGSAIIVPRYVQRFIRDIWRLQSFQTYTIVWKDWFEEHESAYQPELLSGLHEYVLPERFSFLSFYKAYIK